MEKDSLTTIEKGGAGPEEHLAVKPIVLTLSKQQKIILGLFPIICLTFTFGAFQFTHLPATLIAVTQLILGILLVIWAKHAVAGGDPHQHSSQAISA